MQRNYSSINGQPIEMKDHITALIQTVDQKFYSIEQQCDKVFHCPVCHNTAVYFANIVNNIAIYFNLNEPAGKDPNSRRWDRCINSSFHSVYR